MERKYHFGTLIQKVKFFKMKFTLLVSIIWHFVFKWLYLFVMTIYICAIIVQIACFMGMVSKWKIT